MVISSYIHRFYKMDVAASTDDIFGIKFYRQQSDWPVTFSLRMVGLYFGTMFCLPHGGTALGSSSR